MTNTPDKLINKHDELSKKFLTDLEGARSFLEVHLDKQVLTKCDLNTLSIESGSYIDNDLRERFSDILYRLDRKDKSSCVYIYTLIEHQSKAEKMMPLRILRYKMEILQNHIDKYKTDDNLPLVVPIVLYNGKKSPYPYSTDIYDLFTDRELSISLGLGKFSLVDLTVMAEDDILKHKKLALLETLLKHIRARDFAEVVNYMLEAFLVAHNDNISKNLFDGALSYLIYAREGVELQPLLAEIINKIPESKENVMTYAEELMQKGRQEGRQEGEQLAQQKMVQEMLNANLDLSIIEKISHLTKEEINKIKETMH